MSKSHGALHKISRIVEKPLPDDAPSTMAVVGRYILSASIFDELKNQQPGIHGEIQLTDGIANLLKKEDVSSYRFDGKRYDCGSKIGCLQAVVDSASRHPEVNDEFTIGLRIKTEPAHRGVSVTV